MACQRQVDTYLHRRLGREVLHGAAVRSPEGIVCLCGPSGSGKSTLSAAMRLGGLDLLGDDDILLGEENEQPRVLPNYPGSRLSAESTSLLNLNNSDLSIDFHGSDKFIWPRNAPSNPIAPSADLVQAIVVLENTEKRASRPDLGRLRGALAFEILWQQLKWPWMSPPAARIRQFRLITTLVRDTFIFSWNPPRETPAAMAAKLLRMLEAKVAAACS